MMFNHPACGPILATRLQSFCMPPRDVTYGSMMRPLQMIDPFNEDHYDHNDKEKAFQKLPLGGHGLMAPMTPLPAFQERRITARRRT